MISKGGPKCLWTRDQINASSAAKCALTRPLARSLYASFNSIQQHNNFVKRTSIKQFGKGSSTRFNGSSVKRCFMVYICVFISTCIIKLILMWRWLSLVFFSLLLYSIRARTISSVAFFFLSFTIFFQLLFKKVLKNESLCLRSRSNLLVREQQIARLWQKDWNTHLVRYKWRKKARKKKRRKIVIVIEQANINVAIC